MSWTGNVSPRGLSTIKLNMTDTGMTGERWRVEGEKVHEIENKSVWMEP